MNIIETMEGPLAAYFAGGTWDGWKAFLRALFALPMAEDDLALYRHHTGRDAPPLVPFKEAALVCGRRGGKSRILALVATYLATCRDYKPLLAAGEVATIAVIAADRKQARQIFRYITGLFERVPMLKGDVDGAPTAETITLKTGVMIEVVTASYRVTRGYSFAAVLADELAFWRSDESSANPDEEILKAVRPGLSTIPGSMLLLASSPYSRKGALYKTWLKNYGSDLSRVLVWRGATQEMNPGIDPDFIAQAYEDDPASAAAEYGAEFRDDISSFVDREVVVNSIVRDRFELPPARMATYTAFADPSGGRGDSFTLAIAHRSGDTGVLDLVREIRPPFSPEAVVQEFAETLKSYGIYQVVGDRYAGEWPVERFREHGISYISSERTKSEIYLNSLPLLNSGRFELLDIPRLTSQLCGLERRTARGGRDSIDHAPGAHDDVCNAALGALLTVTGGTDIVAILVAAYG